MNELDMLKYEIYKKSGKADYITYKQFIENTNVAYTFSELQKQKDKRKSKKAWKKKKNGYKVPTTKVVKK